MRYSRKQDPVLPLVGREYNLTQFMFPVSESETVPLVPQVEANNVFSFETVILAC